MCTCVLNTASWFVCGLINYSRILQIGIKILVQKLMQLINADVSFIKVVNFSIRFNHFVLWVSQFLIYPNFKRPYYFIASSRRTVFSILWNYFVLLLIYKSKSLRSIWIIYCPKLFDQELLMGIFGMNMYGDLVLDFWG